jgi:hypothetical protein
MRTRCRQAAYRAARKETAEISRLGGYNVCLSSIETFSPKSTRYIRMADTVVMASLMLISSVYSKRGSQHTQSDFSPPQSRSTSSDSSSIVAAAGSREGYRSNDTLLSVVPIATNEAFVDIEVNFLGHQLCQYSTLT